ncbi:MAG: acyl carrier protein [Oligoflexales bacterium]
MVRNKPKRNSEDKKIKSIWSQLLRSPIDYESDFFGLGGNSILAVTLMNKIKLTLHHDFELRLIYKHPVYGEFIHKIASQLGK